MIARGSNDWRCARWLLATIVALCTSSVARGDEPSAEHVKFFEMKVRPLLVARCFECHGGDEL
jgi:hypothetical protein